MRPKGQPVPVRGVCFACLNPIGVAGFAVLISVVRFMDIFLILYILWTNKTRYGPDIVQKWMTDSHDEFFYEKE